jgi:flagellar protein FliO/FliZ
MTSVKPGKRPYHVHIPSKHNAHPRCLAGSSGAKLTGAARLLSGGSGQGARLRVQETLALDRARRLHIVHCDGRDLLLLTGGPGDLAVGWLPNVEDAT